MLLVNNVPSFKVPRLSLQLGNVLHLTNQELEDLVLKCRNSCDNLSLSYTVGDSAIFMSEADIQLRLHWVAGLLSGLVSYPVETFGFTYGDKSHSVAVDIDLQGLVSLQKGLYLGTTKPWTTTEQRVINWLKAEGITFDQWNTKGTSGPVSYSVTTA